MRILIAIHGFPPTYYTGAEQAAVRIVRWLVENGHEVEVFALEALDTAEFKVDTRQENGYTIHRVHYNLKSGDPFKNSYDSVPLGESLAEILAAGSFDLMHIVSGYLLGRSVIVAAKTAAVPVVITLTEYWFMCARLNLLHLNGSLCSGPESHHKCARCLLEDKRRYRLPAQVVPGLADLFWRSVHNAPFVQAKASAVAERQTALREALSQVDLIISPSRFLIQKFGEFGFDMSRSVYIRHGLTLPDSFHRSTGSRATQTLRLGYIGQIKSHKGPDLLVEAVTPLLDQRCNISVDLWGPENEDSRYARNLRARTAPYPAIQWHGPYDGSKVWDVLSTFDVLVVPSRWYENSPTVIAEAHTAGVPVIVTRLGGMAELVEHEKSGLHFELNDDNDLSRQIKRLLDEPALLTRLRSGIPPVKSADDEAMEIFQQYQAVLGQAH